MNLKKYTLILMALLIAGCSSEDTSTPQSTVTTPAATQKAAKQVVMINPVSATVQSVITLNADPALLANATIDWYVNGTTAGSSDSTRLESSELTKGDIIQAIITKGKKEYYSNEIRVRNTPPRIKKAAIFPALPKVGASLSLELDAYDVDEDTIYYKYNWTVNGKFMSDENYLVMDFKRDDMIVVEITPYDSDDSGNTIFAKNKIFNSPPTVTGNTPSFDGKTYRYDLTATDINNDSLTYRILEGPQGMSVDTSGLITWEVRPEDEGRHEFTVSVNDNNGGELVVPITTRISFK